MEKMAYTSYFVILLQKPFSIQIVVVSFKRLIAVNVNL